VDVDLGVFGEVKVDDVGDAVDVDAGYRGRRMPSRLVHVQRLPWGMSP
jgi:hypothetical protein